MDLTNKTIAVTGASGMLGPYLCRALVASGARVRGVIRNPKKASFLESEGVELATADLMDRAALTAAFRGCDAVISNAALYRVFNLSWQDNYRANKEGTENVYEAAAAASAPRIVHMSTFGVYRWHLGKPAIDDASPTLDGSRKQGGAYRGTKQLGEALAFEISAQRGLQTTAIRPAGIYGARDYNLMPWLRRWMWLPVIVAPKFWFPFVYAGDIANAVVGALKNDASAGQRYITAGANATLFDLINAYKIASGKSNLVWPLPLGGLGMYVDCSRAEREIGFAPRSFVDGMRETIADDRKYRAAGVG